MKLPNGKLGVITAVMFFAGAAVAALPSQYNISLTAQPVETPIGAITHPYAATADEVADTESKTVKRITDGVYRLGGWGCLHPLPLCLGRQSMAG